MGRKAHDLTGLRVGNLLVVERDMSSSGKGKVAKWICSCDCGNTVLKLRDSLQESQWLSCGCKTNPNKGNDYTGVRFGRIVGIKRTGTKKFSQFVWLWRCDCGETFESVAGGYVYKDYSTGCPKCTLAHRAKIMSECKTTHGMSNSKEYKSWVSIRGRSFDVNNKEYPNYGAKGIVICDEWKDDFPAFFSYIGPMPRDGERYTCGRGDNALGYEPGNVRWETYWQQARNKSLQENNTSGISGVVLDNKRSKHYLSRTTL